MIKSLRSLSFTIWTRKILRTEFAEIDLDALDNQTPTEHIRNLDTVLNCCYRAALANVEEGILQRHAKRPTSEVTFSENDYVNMT